MGAASESVSCESHDHLCLNLGNPSERAHPDKAVLGWDDVLRPIASVPEVDRRHGQAVFESVLLV